MIFSSRNAVTLHQIQSRSTHMAMPMPPPMHSVARPFLASRFCISCSSVTRTRAPEAPIGWPMAIAPPLTLTLAVSQPRSLLTAQACAAKASLASIRSRSPIVPAGLLQRLARGRDRAGAHDRGIDAGRAPRRRCGRAASCLRLAACFGGHQHDRGGAVIDAGGVAGGDGAVLVEGGLQLGHRFERGAVRGCIRRRRRRCRPCGS